MAKDSKVLVVVESAPEMGADAARNAAAWKRDALDVREELVNVKRRFRERTMRFRAQQLEVEEQLRGRIEELQLEADNATILRGRVIELESENERLRREMSTLVMLLAESSKQASPSAKKEVTVEGS